MEMPRVFACIRTCVDVKLGKLRDSAGRRHADTNRTKIHDSITFRDVTLARVALRIKSFIADTSDTSDVERITLKLVKYRSTLPLMN